MADADFAVTIDGLHAAITAQLQAAFPDLKTVEFYRALEDEGIATPALLLEMSEAEPSPDDDAGSEQAPFRLRFEARVVMQGRTPSQRQEMRKLATSLATWLWRRRWAGLPADACQVIACEPDEFAPVVEKFVVWRVEWVQLVFLGESAWINDGAVPLDLYAFAPDIGLPHEPGYIRADGLPR